MSALALLSPVLGIAAIAAAAGGATIAWMRLWHGGDPAALFTYQALAGRPEGDE
jgi:hypothetical protein